MPKQRLNYPLKVYQKAVETLAPKKGFERVRVVDKKGSAVRFDVFCKGEEVPQGMWTIHTEHDKARRITSKEDYRKGAAGLHATIEEFIAVLEELS